MYQRARRHQNVVGICSMTGSSAVRHVAVWTELFVPQSANFTDAAAGVVVYHDPVANGESRRGTWPELGDLATWLMPGDHLGGLCSTVAVQVRAAESRGANLHHGFAGARMRVWKLDDLGLSITAKHDATHTLAPPWFGRTLQPLPVPEDCTCGPLLFF